MDVCIKVFIDLGNGPAGLPSGAEEKESRSRAQAFRADLVDAWNGAVNAGKGGYVVVSVIIVRIEEQWEAGCGL